MTQPNHQTLAVRHAMASGNATLPVDWNATVPSDESGSPPSELTPADVDILLARACYVLGLSEKTFGPGAAHLLAAIRWDGHAHDLRAFVAGLAQRVEASQISVADVLAELDVAPRLPAVPARGMAAGAARADESLREARRRFEREYVQQVLEQHHYNVRESAAVLGIQRTNLYRKLKALRLRNAIPD